MGERVIPPILNVHEEYMSTIYVNPYRFPTGGGAATSTFEDSDSLNSGATSPHTFSAMTLGGGFVIVGVTGEDVVSAVTADGVSLTEVGSINGTSGGHSGVWIGTVVSGSGDVVITKDGSSRLACVVWSSDVTVTSNDSSGSTADPAATTLNVSVGGFAVGIGYPGTANGTSIWVGIDEDVDANFTGSSNRKWSGASKNIPGGDASLSVSQTFSSSDSFRRCSFHVAFEA